jgi:hypothetical protein
MSYMPYMVQKSLYVLLYVLHHGSKTTCVFSIFLQSKKI